MRSAVAGLRWPPPSVGRCTGSFGDHQFLALIAEGSDLPVTMRLMLPTTKALELRRNRRAGEQHLQPVTGGRYPQDGRLPSVLLSGSVFEGGEGAGSQGLPDFSPYGLSRRSRPKCFAIIAFAQGIGLGKFVIPNPFGPYEEPGSQPISSRIGWPAPLRTAPARRTSETISMCRCWPKSTPICPQVPPKASPRLIPAVMSKVRPPSHYG